MSCMLKINIITYHHTQNMNMKMRTSIHTWRKAAVLKGHPLNKDVKLYIELYIAMEKVPDIKPIKLKEYNVKQSKYIWAAGYQLGQLC